MASLNRRVCTLRRFELRDRGDFLRGDRDIRDRGDLRSDLRGDLPPYKPFFMAMSVSAARRSASVTMPC